jgi:5-amino-6-(5-phosphoribosylamino)uracil reductase
MAVSSVVASRNPLGRDLPQSMAHQRTGGRVPSGRERQPEARVTQCPYVLLSVAMSVDGCIDDATGDRLILSNEADLDRVDEVRAGSDAILVGAGTIRRDNPALLVRSKLRRNRRIAGGLPPSPARVMLTVSGDLDPSARFFTAGEGARLVYVPAGERDRVTGRIGGVAGVEVIGVGGAPRDPPGGPDRVGLPAVLADLAARGVRRLMVEGGGSVLAQFLAEGLADELDLVVAPLFVGDPAAPRVAGLPAGNPRHRMHLTEVRLIGDVVLMRYLPGAAGAAPHRSSTK